MTHLRHGDIMANALTGAIVRVVETYNGFGHAHFVSYRVMSPDGARYDIVLGRHLRAAMPGETRNFIRENAKLIARIRQAA